MVYKSILKNLYVEYIFQKISSLKEENIVKKVKKKNKIACRVEFYSTNPFPGGGEPQVGQSYLFDYFVPVCKKTYVHEIYFSCLHCIYYTYLHIYAVY